MTNILTIWWWNWHSAVLNSLYNNLNWDENFNISAIVSMSDDGRTTGVLMREMKSQLDTHLPPPWDLRRCLFSLSNSKYRNNFSELFEKVLDFDWNISDYSIFEILNKLNISENFIDNLSKFNFLNYRLNLNSPIKWHKFWNLLMANIYYNLDKDYNKMMEIMHSILEVNWNVIPVTTDPAFIQAELTDWSIIETQDKISNVADYNSPIKNIDLMENSKEAKLNKNIEQTVKKADYILIWPWDLYTSINSNFIIDDFQELIQNSKAKIIFILKLSLLYSFY